MSDGARPDMDAIRAAVVGGVSLRKAAAHFGVSLANLERRSSAEDWMAARGQLQGEVRAELERAVHRKLIADGLSAVQVADQLAAEIEEVVAAVAADLRAMEPANKTREVKARAEAAASAAAALARVHDVRRRALGLDGPRGPGSDLEEVLRRMEESGEIAAPRVMVSPESQEESGAEPRA
jgi:hypothetical protein